MAFNLSERFPQQPLTPHIFEPGAYQYDAPQVKPNKIPFLRKCPRNTTSGKISWTQAIYNPNVLTKIPNCASLKSKCPRFPYEAFSSEDLKAFLCKCGFEEPCECSTGEDVESHEVLCQKNVKRRIIIGPSPKSLMGGGLSAPSNLDHGFEILSNGTQKRLLKKVNDESPPFYDAHVHESTSFYQGCKWSKWTSKRGSMFSKTGPGPADYCLERQLTDFEVCIEKLRAHKRKTSKQMRFIEMVQHRNILEGRPGPATYSSKLPKGYEVLSTGPKAQRFSTSETEVRPGPTDHWIKRSFDKPDPPKILCHARLPEPSFFGVKAVRFKPRTEEGPSPATYDPIYYKPCHYVQCSAPFGSSSVRFKELAVEENDEESILSEDEVKKEVNGIDRCISPSWEFKSKTIRLKPLRKMFHEPSPADLPQSRLKVHRRKELQYLAPFFSSEGRFRPWFDWMPVFGNEKTPGPCYYSLNKPKCHPAVTRGPLFRSPRFSKSGNRNPSPNKYNVSGGIETVLATHNQKLKKNIENQHTFKWEPQVEPRKLTNEEQEMYLLEKSITLLDN